MRKVIIIITLFLSVTAVKAQAFFEELPQTITEELHSWFFDADTIGRGYTISTPDEQFFVGVLPNVLKGETDVTIKVFDHVNFAKREFYQVNSTATDDETASRITVDWSLPEGKEIISPIYEFDIKGAADLYNPEKPLWLRMHYPTASQENKGVYFYDKGRKEWIPIPVTNTKSDQSLRAAIHLTYAPMAVLADVIPTVGEASWYKYHGCLCAASRHYPNGSLLQVTHVKTGNQVVVEVNDYGPEAWTERLIDLDVVAFERLVPRTWGITQVVVKPYLPTPEDIEQGLLPEHFDPTL